MIESIRNPEIRKLLWSSEITHQERITTLMRMRDDARAEQRMASEGPANAGDGIDDRLRELEIALDELGESPAEQEGLGPASL